MIVSFPHMGSPVPYKKIFECLGHDVIVPPVPSQRTIDMGVKYSPEFACFPFKVLLGTYMEAIELGAKVIISSGGHGPCRAGFYSEVQQRILQQLNMSVEFIIFDSPNHGGYQDFWHNLIRLKGKSSWFHFMRSVNLVYHMIHILDQLERQLEIKRAYEVVPGTCSKTWEKIQEDFSNLVNVSKDLKAIENLSKERIEKINVEVPGEDEKIRIGIVGEIYVVMEKNVNMKLEEKLGALGVEVERSQYLSHWVDYNMIPKWIKHSHEEAILKKGEKYIEINIGGHAKQTVGHIVDYKERGFDGIIHLMPFACLPELVSQSIIPRISQELDIPVISFSIDEQTGLANNLTRIEAFVDLIRNKKRRLIYNKCVAGL